MKHDLLTRAVAVWILSLFISFQANSAVTVTPAPTGTCLNVSPGAYLAIGTIQISENIVTDYAVQAATTLILTAPANFQFNPGVGTVSFTGGRDISSASVAITATTITVTLTVGTNVLMDDLFINGVQARATASASSGQILRLAGSGGTATITGDAPGGGINHGTLMTGGLGYTSAANGDWTNPATWGGTVPNCNALVTINHTVTVDAAASVTNLTINTGGDLVSDNDVTVGGTFTINGTGVYTHNNTTNATTTIFNGTESFSSTSVIQVDQWHDRNTPLATGVTGNFGNVTLNAGGTATPWDHDGMFSTNTIQGTLTISSGQVTMDDGTGGTTSLTLQDVLVTGTGNLELAAGSNRNLTLVTNNFTDNSTSAAISYIMYRTYGTLDWTVNGDLNLSHTFQCVAGTGSQTENATVHVTGDMNITGGTIDFIRNVDGTLSLTVDGNTTINTAGIFQLIDAADNDLTFSTTDLIISGTTTNNYLQGSVGTIDVDISNDFIASGTGRFRFTRNTSNTNTATIDISGDAVCTAGETQFSYGSQDFVVTVTGDILVSNSSTEVIGEGYSNGSGNPSFVVAGNVIITDGSFTMTEGRGSVDLDLTGMLQVNDGIFWGVNKSATGNWGTGDFDIGSVDYNGGRLYFFDGGITDGKTVTINIVNDFDINFLASTDRVHLLRPDADNNALLDLDIGGDLIVSGLSSGCYFLSNAGTGNQAVDIVGSILVSGGQMYWVGTESSGNAHDLVMNVTGEFSQSAGNVVWAALDGTSTIAITENYTITGGTSTLKWDNGQMTLTISGDYIQSGGTFNFHTRNTDTPDSNTLEVYGNFLHTGGTIEFDERAGNTNAEHSIDYYGTIFTLGGTGVISHDNHLTANTVFGNINFNTAGTVVFNRSSATHDLRHIRQTIAAGTTVDGSGSANNFQVSSHSSSTFADHNTLTINGTLAMGTAQVFARQQANYYAALTVASGGRFRTRHTGGFYSGSATASAVDGMISGNNRMDYSLDANSTIEYYGVDNQIVTGVPNGIATGTQHEYGNLDINFTGTADTEFVYPETTNEVFIRGTLVMSNGEFNLDNDHNTVSGGMTISLRNGATTSRTNGYVRSEVDDGTGIILWNITTTGGTHIFPFGYNSTNYIPFTFAPTAGSSGDVSMSTYHTLANNVPYPPSVNHLNDLVGSDNSANTVDRFWRFTVTGSPTVDVTYTATVAEVGGITNPRAQRWRTANNGWEPALGIQSNPTGTSTLVSGLTGLDMWWTLSSATFPLPVEISSFTASCSNGQNTLNWITESETNNDYFAIERSTYNQAYTRIGVVQGNGTTSGPTHYSFTDPSKATQMVYYRLRQFDYDGDSQVHGPVAARPCASIPVHSIELAFYDNGTVTLDLVANGPMTDEVRLYNLTGQMLDSRKLFTEGGKVRVVLGKNLTEGVYLISLGSGERKLVGGLANN